MKLVSHLLELVVAAISIPIVRLRRLLGLPPTRVTIVGWWGSETVGDEAILGQLLDECSDVRPNSTICLVSFDPRVSRRTLSGLDRMDVTLVPVGAASGWAVVSSRCVIYGGGPLLESATMPLWAARAALARAAGARLMLYACGIGPIRTRRTSAAVRLLVRLADPVVVRDDTSASWATSVRKGKPVLVTTDPAFAFVRRMWSRAAERHPHQLALVLRTPPRSALGSAGTALSGDAFLTVLASSLNDLLVDGPVRLVGCVMYSEPGETNDHDVYARLAKKLDRPDRLEVTSGYHSADYIVRTLRESAAALTVRFHGMVFAIATETPFLAIDYELPSGKVSATAALEGREDAVINWTELDRTRLSERLRAIMLQPSVRPSENYTSASEIRRRALRDAMR